MIYITARDKYSNVVTIEVQDDKLVERLILALIKQGYDMIEVKGWAAE